MRLWKIYKHAGEWDDVIEGPDTGPVEEGLMVVAVTDLLSAPMCDRILDELVVQAGGDRGFTDDRVPFARWDMRAALDRALTPASTRKDES